LGRAEPQLLRNVAKLSTAVFITAALGLACSRIEFLWYPLLAVLIVVDDNDAKTVKAATGRILGTVVGGLITFLVHTILQGAAGVMVSFLLMVPVLRCFGWQNALSTAGLVSVMFMKQPTHAALNWNYVFNRALDTAVGCVVAVGVSLLFWPRSGLAELQAAEHGLLTTLAKQLALQRHWLQGHSARPEPLPPAWITQQLQTMGQRLAQEQSGPRQQLLQRQHWSQRHALWQEALHHWQQWELQLLALPVGPEGCAVLLQGLEGLAASLANPALAAPLPPGSAALWAQRARDAALPLLAVLSLAEEQEPLQRILASLIRLRQRLELD